MKSLLPVLFLFSPLLLNADIAFHLRRTTSGHPKLVQTIRERTSRVSISGGKIAFAYSDVVSIEDRTGNQITIVDHASRKFAVSALDHQARRVWTEADLISETDVRSELIENGVPSEHNGMKTRRDVIRLLIRNAPGPGIMTIEMHTIETMPGFEESRQPLESAAKRRDGDIEAMINTLVANQPDLLRDLSKISQKLALGIPVYTRAEFRPAKGSPALDEVGEEFEGHAVITIEQEAENLTTEVDPTVFLAPVGYGKVDFEQLFNKCAARVRD